MESALRIRNEHRNSIPMTRHCNWLQPIRSTTQIWVVTRHQYGVSTPVSQASFGGETSGDVAKCLLPSQVIRKFTQRRRRRLRKRHLKSEFELPQILSHVMHVQSCCFANLNQLFLCRSRCRPRRCVNSLLESISVKQSSSWCRTANNFLNSNSTRNQVDDKPLCGCATSKSLFIVKKAPFLKQRSLEAFTLHSVSE